MTNNSQNVIAILLCSQTNYADHGNVIDFWSSIIYLNITIVCYLSTIYRTLNSRTACTEFFSWFQCIQTVFKINKIIYRNKLFTDEFHYLKWIITCTEIVFIYIIVSVLFYIRHHILYVKSCFQQNRYVFDVIVTSWALFVFCISWNFAQVISTVFQKIKHLRSRAPDNSLPHY
jgi:lysylphosphatidylglycerol synthetase-like protein (DUF2156 family)